MFRPSRGKPAKKSPSILLASQLDHPTLREATKCIIHYRPPQLTSWFPLHIRTETMCDYQAILRKRYADKGIIEPTVSRMSHYRIILSQLHPEDIC